MKRSFPVASAAAATVIAAFLFLFLVLPVGAVIWSALGREGHFTFQHFVTFFEQSLLRESFWNSLTVAVLSTLFASLIAVPLAVLAARFRFRGAILISALGVLPLVMPPFVGAVSMQLIFGTNGSVNLLLNDWFGFKLPIMEDLRAVVFVESIHYFPFILMNLVASLQSIDGSLEESARNLGATGFRLFRRVIFPLALPGYVAGVVLVFVKVFDDLGTPLVLGVSNMLAPQAYLRITSLGIDDPLGFVISFMMIGFSIAAMWLSAYVLKNRQFSSAQNGSVPLRKRTLGKPQSALAYCWIVLVLLIVLSPHLGILLLSLGSIWSYAVLPDAFTLQHYAAVVVDSGGMIANTLVYCGLSALIDIVLGTVIAYLMLRTKLAGRYWLDYIASAAIAVPGIVLAIGYLRLFRNVAIPFTDTLFTQSAILIIIAYAVRRLPYALRSCIAALQQVNASLEEAAETLGVSKASTIRRIMIPLMAGGMLAGFVTSFITAAVELSATLVLTSSESQAPMSYGIYLYMQSVAGRGPGAALGVLAILVVALGTYISHVIVERASRLNRSRPLDGATTLQQDTAIEGSTRIAGMITANEVKVKQ